MIIMGTVELIRREFGVRVLELLDLFIIELVTLAFTKTDFTY